MQITKAPLLFLQMSDDMIGKRYGKLVVETELPNPNPNRKEPYYLCRCDCGGTLKTTKYRLEQGTSYHCGCLRHPDLTGQVFGKVTVLRLAEERNATRKRKPYIWECRCECGNIVYKHTDTLKNKDVTMCAECADKVHTEKARANAGFANGTQISKIRSDKLSKANKSGVKGVCLDKRSGKWRAGIKFKGQSINLGYYAKFEDAVKARQRGEEEYFGAFLEAVGSGQS